VKFLNVNTVESKDGDLVVINRNGKLVISRREGARARALRADLRLAPAGQGGRRGQAGQELVEWDPFTSAILTEIAGKVEFQDIVEGENVREETDKVTGLSQRIIVEASATEKRAPAMVVKGRPARAALPAALGLAPRGPDGERHPGDTLAKIPRETTKTKDITGGLPRVQELFEARNPEGPGDHHRDRRHRAPRRHRQGHAQGHRRTSRARSAST
jgi:DNA-directed RNA polymerase subunit beta'